MAIIFEQQKKSINWVPLVVTAFLVAFVAFAIYYLFFAPTPRIEIVLPAALERAQQISTITFIDPKEVIQSDPFKKLRSYVPAPMPAQLGRPNPFIPL